MKKELEFKLSPQELASEFCEMSGHEQAQFFTQVVNIAAQWGDFAAQQQWLDISRCLLDSSTAEVRTRIRDLSCYFQETI